MYNLTTNKYIPAMTQEAIDKVRALEEATSRMPQVDIQTQHLLHAGMYARTIFIPAGVILTGALIKIATVLIVQGEVIIYTGGDSVLVKGYNILPAEANRKQAFFAQTDTYLTMIFNGDAASVEEAENMFTDEADRLLSRKTITEN